ncbi:hypothetical protein A3863_07250 (plasmid) [Priestia endophytica]|uniref:YfmQ family protein n=1 Tax=Priestia endophytica TaxID=135735 RepID=UPI000DCA3A2A|nr:YfmQ family protein [Priestia endophytica]RAS91018.1 hypothetical protein A3863_07250 [Priestia endophytica]
MTWFFIISLVIVSLLKIVVTSPPNFIAEWFVTKFELHSKFDEKDVNIKVGESQLLGKDKDEALRSFNEAVFLNRYDLFPKTKGVPMIIEAKKGNKYTKFLVYTYSDHIDVFKHSKKTIVAYRVFSDVLQEKANIKATY